MYVKDVHKDADAPGPAHQVRILHVRQTDDLPVRGADDRLRIGRNRSDRIAEEIEHEPQKQPERKRDPETGEEMYSDSHRRRDRDVRPAFAGEQRVTWLSHEKWNPQIKADLKTDKHR